jgi:hypothetical protein
LDGDSTFFASRPSCRQLMIKIQNALDVFILKTNFPQQVTTEIFLLERKIKKIGC